MAPVRIAMSSSMALRRSPKPGALTAQVFRMPRSELTTSVASASPVTSSAISSSGRFSREICSSSGSRSRIGGNRLVVDEHVRVLQHDALLFRVVDEVRRQEAAVELHAFDDFELVGHAAAVLGLDDAVVADFLHRLRDHLADRGVAVGRDRADLGDLLTRAARPRIALELGDDGLDRRRRCRA